MFVKPPKIVGTVEVIDVVDSIPRVVVRLRDLVPATAVALLCQTLSGYRVNIGNTFKRWCHICTSSCN